MMSQLTSPGKISVSDAWDLMYLVPLQKNVVSCDVLDCSTTTGLCQGCTLMLFSSASAAGSIISDKNEWCATVPKDIELLEPSNKCDCSLPQTSVLLSLSTGLILMLYIGLILKSTQKTQLVWLEGGTTPSVLNHYSAHCAQTVHLFQGQGGALPTPGKAICGTCSANPTSLLVLSCSSTLGE